MAVDQQNLAKNEHDRAVSLWRAGALDLAEKAFGAALAACNRPEWRAERAELARLRGDRPAAVDGYRRALSDADGDQPLWRLRLAIALKELERLSEALDELDTLVADHAGWPIAWQTLGAVRRDADDQHGALAAFDEALALEPGNPLSLLSRATMLAELGMPATEAFAAATRAQSDGGPAMIGLAISLTNEARDGEASAILDRGLAVRPDWIEGWQARASLAAQAGGTAAMLAIWRRALVDSPTSATLYMAAIRAANGAEAFDQALAWIDAARRKQIDGAPLLLAEAEARSARGEPTASKLFDLLADVNAPIVRLARTRHLLKYREPLTAAVLAERLAVNDGVAMAWPYLGTAWRMLDDPRSDWLDGDPRLIGTYPLGLSEVLLADIGATLRSLHKAKHAPVEQSMRGGTQTEGALLGRDDRSIATLRASLMEALGRHIAQLPPADPTHPTLSQSRQRQRLTGSWSVRLIDGGYHVAHVHSEGWLSSACYIGLPQDMGDHGDGWLTLGAPPTNLDISLPPRRAIRPRVGEVTFFPSIMWHATTPFGRGERLTVAFDVKPLT